MNSDWTCSCGCINHGSKNRLDCYRCRRPKGESKGESKSDRDWKCSCGFLVYGSREVGVCPKCHQSKSSVNNPIKNNSDWTCSCGCVNHGSKNRGECYRCNKPKHKTDITYGCGHKGNDSDPICSVCNGQVTVRVVRL